MKRVVSVLLLFILITTFAFAEGQGESGTRGRATGGMNLQGRVLKYIAWWNPAPDGEMWQAKVAYLENKYNFRLENINSGDWNRHHDDLVASIAAGDPKGDYVYVDQAFFAGFVTEGLILPVDDMGIDFSQSYYHQGKRDGFTLKGREYSIKDSFIEPGVGWWFNKSMLEREGLENIYDLQREGRWTWDKMLEMARAVTRDLNGDGNIDQWAFGEDPLHMGAMAFIASNGGNIVADGQFVLDTPQNVEALQFYQDLNIRHRVVGMRPEDSEWNWAYHQFGSGKIAFLPFFFWASDSQFGDPEDEIGWAMFPEGPRGEMTSIYYPGNTVVLPVGIKDPEKALYVWDQIWAPNPEFEDPDASPFDWLYGVFYDIESIEESQSMMSIGGHFTTFTHEIFGFKNTWEGVPGEILRGEKSPRAAIDEVKPVFLARLRALLGN